jgi:predicted nuclease with TOPRIM domain
MEREQIQSQRYALSLDKTIQSHYHYLKGNVEEFQEKCQRVTPERKIPPDIINQIRGAYKEIRDRLNEIRAIQQLLQTKYRQFYHRDPTRDKEITECESLSKNAYSKFEYILKQIEAKKKLERERLSQMSHKNGPPGGTF